MKSKAYKAVFFSWITLVVLLSFTGACRPKPIKINVESAPPKLVVFSHVVPEKSMIVALTKSFSALEGVDNTDINSFLVSGAKVQIKFDNQLFDFTEINPGVYVSYNEAYQVNEEYELIITHNGETVTAKTVMLPKTTFSECVPEVIKNPGDTSVFVSVKFSDNPSINNWYLINIYKRSSSSNPLDGINYFQNGKNVALQTYLVSDKEFGTDFSKRFEVKEVYHDDSIAVTLSNINEKYFDYLKLRGNGGSVFTQLNLEPVTYPTNVVNGYGFFNAHNPSLKYFDLSEY